jgi:hypothetical protein
MSEPQFCATCRAESSDEAAGGIQRGIFGREFMGQARACADCGSYVATLWRVFLYFPLIPIGSYRYKHDKVHFGSVTFYSRRVPLDLEQVKKTRRTGSISALVVLVLAAILIYWQQS